MSRRGQGPVGDGGLVVVDKPSGMTSHDVVARVRRLAGTRRVGHAGTLDPMATGVLVLGVERATRLLGHLALTDKSYDATMRLGQATVTDDAEGDVVSERSASSVDEAHVRDGVARLTGVIHQVPSKVSAIKVDGVRSYAKVRAGEDVELAAREVRVSELTVLALGRATPDLLDVDVRVTCSSGTYIRALARDLGADLGVGGHLTALRRTRVGAFDLAGARSLEQLEASFEVVPLGHAVAASFPRIDVDAEVATAVGHGVKLPADVVDDDAPGPYGVFGPGDRVLALVERHAEWLKPLVVFVG